MHYVLIEGGRVINIINYEPSVPDTVTVHQITDVEYGLIIDNSHYFDLDQLKIVPIPKETADHRLAVMARTNGRGYLSETDWIVLRHIREKALDLPTTLTHDEYIELETERHKVAKGLRR